MQSSQQAESMVKTRNRQPSGALCDHSMSFGKLRNHPKRPRLQMRCNALDQQSQFLLKEAIKEKMCHYEVVVCSIWNEFPGIGLM